MASQKWDIPSLLTIDIDGSVKFPDIKQLLDKDMRTLYVKDKSENKEFFIKELGVIYYIGDPESPANEQGLQFKEALDLAIDNFNLPKDYDCDGTVMRLINKLHNEKITEAGKTILAIKKTLHTELILAEKLQTILIDMINRGTTSEDISQFADHVKTINEIINRIPDSTKALNKAYENLLFEKENKVARGQVQITSSMDATNFE